jgi:hypothetical protein
MQVTLRNGEGVVGAMVSIVQKRLSDMLTPGAGGMELPAAVYELHQICTGKQEKVFSPPLQKILVDRGLMQSDGSVHSMTKDIVLSCLDGEGLDLHMVNPLAEGPLEKTQFKYDRESTVSYGSWECPECGSSFYGGGPAIHKEGCSKKAEGYAGLTYLFSKAEADTILAGKPAMFAPEGLTAEVVANAIALS